MKLRPDLMPPALDEAKVRRLAQLADGIDGANAGTCKKELADFNRLADTHLGFADFQGISGGERHETWVRRVLLRKAIKPVTNVSRAELAEVVRRAMPTTGDPLYEAYMAIFDANVPMRNASSLIFYPLDYDESGNTWGGGRPIGEYDPSPEQIVEWALTRQRP